MNKLQRIIDVTIEVRDGRFHALAHTLNVKAEARNMEKVTRNLLEALTEYYKEKGFWLDYDNLKYSNLRRTTVDEISLVGIYADAVPFTPALFLNIEM